MKTLILLAIAFSIALLQMTGCQKKESRPEMTMSDMMEMCKKDPSMCSKMMSEMMKDNPEMMKNIMSNMMEMCRKDTSMSSMMCNMMMNNSSMMNAGNGMMSRESMMDCMRRIEEKSGK